MFGHGFIEYRVSCILYHCKDWQYKINLFVIAFQKRGYFYCLIINCALDNNWLLPLCRRNTVNHDVHNNVRWVSQIVCWFPSGLCCVWASGHFRCASNAGHFRCNPYRRQDPGPLSRLSDTKVNRETRQEIYEGPILTHFIARHI